MIIQTENIKEIYSKTDAELYFRNRKRIKGDLEIVSKKSREIVKNTHMINTEMRRLLLPNNDKNR